MTITDQPIPATTRPPTLVIVIGFLHTVLGGVMALALPWGCVSLATTLYRISRAGAPLLPSALRLAWTSFLLLPLAAGAFASGLWLLRGSPRGRRWTIVLACASTLLASVRIVHIIFYPEPLGTEPAPASLAACAKDLGFMTYWVIVLLVMHLPSVRRFYTPPQLPAETEESPA